MAELPAAVGDRGAVEPPGTVRYAVRLMLFQLLFCAVASAVLSLDDMVSLYGPESDDEFAGLGQTLFVVALVVAVFLAVSWALLALAVRRGANWARILTWVVAVVASVLGVIFLFTPSAFAFVVVGVVVMGAIGVLLARPASNRYFTGRT